MAGFSPLFQQQKGFQSLLPFQKHLIIKQENGFLHIRTFSNDAVQLQWSRSGHADWFSYAIENEEIKSPEWIETLENISLPGPIQLAFEKISGQISWQQKGGQAEGLEKGLGFGWLGEKALLHIHMDAESNYFGLGEKTGSLLRNGSSFTHWNTDAFGYHDGRDPLYVSIPFFIAIRQGKCYGIFIDNTAKSKINFGASNHRMLQIQVDYGPLNFILIPGPGPADVVRRYGQLTGTPPLPPDWALGLHQSRYSYRNQEEVSTLAHQYWQRDIPLSAIHLDIHYMDAYKVFTTNEKAFPELKKLAAGLEKNGIHLVAIQDPGIKSDAGDSYEPLQSGMKEKVFAMYPDGQPWEASVWPGRCYFPDFTSGKAREWWADQTKNWIKKTGISGLWNDMNEPASWGQDVPDIVEFDLEGRHGNHREAHNVYGQLMAKSTRNGLLAANKGIRPFVLTRAGFSGIQRFAAVWTGDNVANSDHYFLGIRLILSLGMSGVSFSGVDIGGFVGDSSPRLFARWISVGSFFPFFRIHSMIDSRLSDPWSFGETVEAISRNYIRLRYRLFPMWKTAFFQSSISGKPLLTPFFWKQPGFEYKAAFQHQFYAGDNLLVIPPDQDQDAVWAALPSGTWYHLLSGDKWVGPQECWISSPLDQLPVLVRGSSILITESPSANRTKKFQIHVFWGTEPGYQQWYEDDGLTENPNEDDKRLIYLSFHPGKKSTLRWENLAGAAPEIIIEKIVLWHFPENQYTLTQGKQNWKTGVDHFHWMDPLPDFDPFERKDREYFHQCLTCNPDFILVGTGELIIS